jgi:Flp pilus assembly CpaE family ATPase
VISTEVAYINYIVFDLTHTGLEATISTLEASTTFFRMLLVKITEDE